MSLAVAKIAVTNTKLVASYLLGQLDVGTLVDGAKNASQSDLLSPIEDKVCELGGGFYRIMFMAGVFLIIFGLGVAALKLLFYNAQHRWKRFKRRH